MNELYCRQINVCSMSIGDAQKDKIFVSNYRLKFTQRAIDDVIPIVLLHHHHDESSCVYNHEEKKYSATTHTHMAITYDKLFFQAFNCLPNQSKSLEDYSKEELIRLIQILKTGIEKLNGETSMENDDFGFGIIAENEEDLQTFQEFASKNFLPISIENCHVSSTCDQTMIEHYFTTGINQLRSEYAMIILLKHVQPIADGFLPAEKEFSLNNKIYKYQLKILHQGDDETYEELVIRIRENLLGEIFAIDHDDHASIPSLPAPKQPQFVTIFPHTQIACWPLPRRRDLNRFREDLGVTHILTLLNQKEISHSNIYHYIESAGIQSLQIPIEGADLTVFTSPQTIDILIERLPAIRDLLLNSTETAPVKMIIHCSAGLHRTGTITYLLLRMCHFDVDRALLIINRTRAITARQVGKKRIDLAENHLLSTVS